MIDSDIQSAYDRCGQWHLICFWQVIDNDIQSAYNRCGQWHQICLWQVIDNGIKSTYNRWLTMTSNLLMTGNWQWLTVTFNLLMTDDIQFAYDRWLTMISNLHITGVGNDIQPAYDRWLTMTSGLLITSDWQWNPICLWQVIDNDIKSAYNRCGQCTRFVSSRRTAWCKCLPIQTEK